MENQKKIIPVVYSTDNNFVPFMAVSITSILKHSSSDCFYKFYAMHDGLTEERISRFDKFNSDNSSIEFINVADTFRRLNGNLCVRDNWTEAIYYRFLIPMLLPQFDKVIYIDGDTVLLKDIANLYDIDLGDNLLAAVVDEAVSNFDVFKDYVKSYLDIPYTEYFNSGVLVINSHLFRKENLLQQFVNMQKKVVFDVAPDQDYLNVLCRHRVKYIPTMWNKQPIPELEYDEKQIGLLHYNLNLKPWHFDNVRYENYFWEISQLSDFNNEIIEKKKNYGEEDIKNAEKHFNDIVQCCFNCIAVGENTPVKKEDFFDGIRTKD